jgi:hypothetical protein
MLELKRIKKNVYNVNHNTTLLGNIVFQDNVYLFNVNQDVYYNEYTLRLIADLLKDKNSIYLNSSYIDKKEIFDDITTILKEVLSIYKNFNIYISVFPDIDVTTNTPTGNFKYTITSMGNYRVNNSDNISYLTQNEAYLAAIKQVKKDLFLLS